MASEVRSDAKHAAPRDPRRPDHVLARRGGGVEWLRLPAFLMGWATSLRAGLYDRGLLAAHRLEVPVVSIGNLTAGGTGKSPCAVWLCRFLSTRGWRPGILSRGYRAPTDAPDRENDEAQLLARLLPDVPRVQNPDRVAGGRELVRQGVDVIVLDDGFQHRRLARDLDLCLVDAVRPWGLPATDGGAAVRALLPRGLLREKPVALARADSLCITRSDLVTPEALLALESELEEIAPGRPILHAVHRPVGLRTPDGKRLHPSALRGREVDLVSGIGNPEALEGAVRALGGEVRTHRAFPDHHAFQAADLDGLGRDEGLLVATAKDAVKLAAMPVHVLEVEFELARGGSVFEALLDALPVGRQRRQREALHEGLHG